MCNSKFQRNRADFVEPPASWTIIYSTGSSATKWILGHRESRLWRMTLWWYLRGADWLVWTCCAGEEESSLAPDGSTLANKCRYLAPFPLSGNFAVELCAYCLITMSHYLPTLTKSTFPRVNLPRRKTILQATLGWDCIISGSDDGLRGQRL